MLTSKFGRKKPAFAGFYGIRHRLHLMADAVRLARCASDTECRAFLVEEPQVITAVESPEASEQMREIAAD